MKRIIALIAFVACTLGFAAQAQNSVAEDTATTNSKTSQSELEALSAFVESAAPWKDDTDTEAVMALMIPLIAVSFPFIMVVLVVFLVLRAESNKRKAKYKLMEAIVAAGQPVPDGLIEEKEPAKSRNPYLWPMIFIGIGLGSLVLFFTTGENDGYGISAIFILVGAGMLVADRLQKKSNKKEEDAASQTPKETL